MNYEQGGIVITIAVVGICLSIGMITMADVPPPSGTGGGSGGTWAAEEKEPKSDWSAYYDYYKNNNIDKQQCKQAAFDLQDYFDCVND